MLDELSTYPMRNVRLALALCTFVIVAAPATASAQRTAADLESARQLYNQGIELRDKGDTKSALEKFRAAHALGNTPITGIELCKAHAKLNQPVEAREICLGVARIPPLAQETPRSQEARNEAGQIAEDQRAKISAVRLNIKGVPPGREPTVTVDGVAVPAAALNEPRAVNPGVHVITARVGQGAETRATLETRPGESRDLELAVQPPPADDVAPPPPGNGAVGPEPAQPAKKKNTFATVSFGVAAVSGAVGLVTGIVALSAKGTLDDECPQKNCARDEWDRLDNARAMGTTSTVFFVIAGVALGAGIVATVTSNKGSAQGTTTRPKVTPVLGLGGAGLHGTF
jgi:hypothetical protein